MKNKYPGKCERCGKLVLPGSGRWRKSRKLTQNFTGLRCQKCSTTTKAGLKAMNEPSKYKIE